MAIATLLGATVSPVGAQAPTQRVLSLAEATEIAQRVSPDVRAAVEAAAAARGREMQSRAHPNPTLSYGREQTSARGETNAQNIASLEQRIELGGLRSARIDGAALRREAAEARLAAVRAQVRLETVRAYANVIAADRRARLVTDVAQAFRQARETSERRLAAGDVSAYAHRRIQLEAARYATARAEAALARRTTRVALAALIGESADSIATPYFALRDSLGSEVMSTIARDVADLLPTESRDSLVTLALAMRPERRALDLDVEAARADARLAASERMPTPAVSLGFKNERVANAGAVSGAPDTFTGFTAGFSLPLPLWDRRQGATDAAAAEARRRLAERQSFDRRIAREVAEALDSFDALREQLTLLAPQLGSETAAAMRAVQVAYTEGEITLVEWLDAVRAYQEAEATLATLRAEIVIRRAALEHALGAPIPNSTPSRNGADAPPEE